MLCVIEPILLLTFFLSSNIKSEITLYFTELQDMFVLKNENHDNLLTASILQQFHTAAKPALKAEFVDSPVCFNFLNVKF